RRRRDHEFPPPPYDRTGHRTPHRGDGLFTHLLLEILQGLTQTFGGLLVLLLSFLPGLDRLVDAVDKLLVGALLVTVRGTLTGFLVTGVLVGLGQRVLPTLEEVVERVLQVAADRDLLTEADHDLLEQREGRRTATAGLHVERLHVEQTARERQGQQGASRHPGSGPAQ